MVLQKKYVGWFSQRALRDAAWRRARLGWAIGFALMNLQPVFNYLALLGLPANVVAAMIGVNVAFTSILAALFRGERLFPRRVVGILALFAAIVILGLRGGRTGESFSGKAMFLFGAIPLGLAALVFAFRRRIEFPGLATLIAAIAGSLGGYMVLALRGLQVSTGPGLAGWLTGPYLYLYFVSGFASFSLLQLAFRRGDVTAVSPADYGMQVLWPSLASHFVFGIRLDPVQEACVVAVLLAVFLIAGKPLRLRTARDAAGPAAGNGEGGTVPGA